ncbi:DNA replication/repair protein RecF [Kitasatospora atroaurantiaca]|uniref:DNA replication and repair protein RecF n=1 Tax=Kitasatospora atroaurantiaca TaxID=285545 RepID=A0A561ESK7_9ACTN|nr:DNA replication/repair protein RecF [Kitasatospora atroaurantiaca]TWE18602.1 DNA replication and repair protein RecF [Kitasatospora atroaurantiaca]
MHVAHLSLADFRSYARVEVPLDPGVTAFVGPNGQGKTNLVEAIGYIATLGSHRVATDAPLIRLGAERAVIRTSIVRDGRTTLVELEITPGKANRARINRSDNVRPRDVLGLLRTVLFAPEDLSLVKGDPGERRRFLDELLTARAPRLAGVRQDYERVLKQRNALLKTAAMARRGGGTGKAGDLSTLEVWDGHLARAGAELTAFRLQLVAALQPLVAQAYEQLAPGGGETVLEYRSSFEGALPTSREEAEQQLLAALQEARPQEVARGLTLVGPHRDELGLKLGPLPAKGYASHGESWSYALALRLASYELLRSDGGEPVLILDDVFAELDARRRDQLAELVAGAEQVLVTAAVPEDVPKALSGARFAVADGQVTRLDS